MKNQNPQSPRVLVFGRNGQLAKALSVSGNHPSWLFAGRGKADLAHPGQIEKLLNDGPWDAVINAAAYTTVERAETESALARAINATAPGIMAHFCADKKIPFIHISTDYVFNGEKKIPYVEDDAVNPLNVYGSTKAEGERAVLEAGGKSLVLRTSWVYAPQGSNFLLTMLRLGQERDELRLVADQIGAPTAAFDLANAIEKILPAFLASDDPALTGLFHLTAQGETSWHEYASCIFEFAAAKGVKTPKSLIPVASAYYPSAIRRPLNSRLDCEKMREIYGISLPHWRESAGICMDMIFTSAALKKGAA